MVLLADRRRINGPLGPTSTPQGHTIERVIDQPSKERSRLPEELRKFYIQTGLVPSASGSAYLELSSPRSASRSIQSGLKLACTVHGPRPLPRSAPFTPHLILSTRVKFAPFASRENKGYLPDATERDLASHLETALRPVLLTERWPKSGLDVVITVLEGGEASEPKRGYTTSEWSIMNTLCGCVNVASAAIADAGIDCVDLLTMGVAAHVRQANGDLALVIDPCVSDPEPIVSLCAVGYLQSRDEVTFLWAKETNTEDLREPREELRLQDLVENAAIEAASAVRSVVIDALKSAIDRT